MKPTYDIPCGYRMADERPWENEAIGPEVFPSSTRVFIIPPGGEYNVAQRNLGNVRFFRLPLKPGFVQLQYVSRAPWRDGSEEEHWVDWFDSKLVSLSRASIGAKVMVGVDPRRPRPIAVIPNRDSHALVSLTHPQEGHSGSVTYACGDYNYRMREGENFQLVQDGVPTCPDCLTNWEIFYVLPHTVPHVEERKAERARKNVARAERKILARPTRYDRALDERDAKPPRLIEIPEPDIEEPTGRDAKLVSRTRQAERDRQKREEFKRARRWR